MRSDKLLCALGRVSQLDGLNIAQAGVSVSDNGLILTDDSGRTNVSNIFAAGDNHNDLSMLCGANARMVACPANAVPKVREMVRAAGGYVANAIAGEGMSQALDHYFFGSE